MSWVYKQTEHAGTELGGANLWSVGHYSGTPSVDGAGWIPESDHADPEDAAKRCRWLNGGVCSARPSDNLDDLHPDVQRWIQRLTQSRWTLIRAILGPVGGNVDVLEAKAVRRCREAPRREARRMTPAEWGDAPESTDPTGDIMAVEPATPERYGGCSVYPDSPDVERETVEIALCEIANIVLPHDQKYRLYAVDGCEGCAAYAWWGNVNVETRPPGSHVAPRSPEPNAGVERKPVPMAWLEVEADVTVRMADTLPSDEVIDTLTDGMHPLYLGAPAIEGEKPGDAITRIKAEMYENATEAIEGEPEDHEFTGEPADHGYSSAIEGRDIIERLKLITVGRVADGSVEVMPVCQDAIDTIELLRTERDTLKTAIAKSATAHVEGDYDEAYHVLYWADGGESKGQHLILPPEAP